MPSDDKERFEGLVPQAPCEDDTLFDRLFAEAAARHLAEQDIYPTREELKKEISFTDAFEEQTQAMFQRWGKEHRRHDRRGHLSVHLFRAASVIIAVFLVFGLFAVTSTAARNRIFNFFNQFTNNSVDISFSDDIPRPSDMVMQIPENTFKPQYLPKAFVLDAVVPRGNATELLYTRGEQMIQVVTYTENSNATLNREDAKVSDFPCLGVTATQLVTDTEVVIYFTIDNAMVTLYADIPASELRKVAKSLKK